MPVVEIFSNVGMEEMGLNFKDMFGGMMPRNTRRRKVKVPEAMEIMAQEEAQNPRALVLVGFQTHRHSEERKDSQAQTEPSSYQGYRQGHRQGHRQIRAGNISL